MTSGRSTFSCLVMGTVSFFPTFWWAENDWWHSPTCKPATNTTLCPCLAHMKLHVRSPQKASLPSATPPLLGCHFVEFATECATGTPGLPRRSPCSINYGPIDRIDSLNLTVLGLASWSSSSRKSHPSLRLSRATASMAGTRTRGFERFLEYIFPGTRTRGFERLLEYIFPVTCSTRSEGTPGGLEAES